LLGAKRDGQPFCAAKQAAHSAGSSALSRTTPGRARQTGQSGPRPVIQVRESQRRGGAMWPAYSAVSLRLDWTGIPLRCPWASSLYRFDRRCSESRKRARRCRGGLA